MVGLGVGDVTPTGFKRLGATIFYTDAVPTELKRVLEYARFVDRTRRGSKPRLPVYSLL